MKHLTIKFSLDQAILIQRILQDRYSDWSDYQSSVYGKNAEDLFFKIIRKLEREIKIREESSR